MTAQSGMATASGLWIRFRFIRKAVLLKTISKVENMLVNLGVIGFY
jgi:hypothetical protein